MDQTEQPRQPTKPDLQEFTKNPQDWLSASAETQQEITNQFSNFPQDFKLEDSWLLTETDKLSNPDNPQTTSRYLVEGKRIYTSYYSTVYKAYDTKTKRIVAIKCITQEDQRIQPEQLAQLEAWTHATFDPVHTIPVYEVETNIPQNPTKKGKPTDETMSYIVMEYQDPQEVPTLQTILDETEGYGLPLDQVQTITTHIAEAIDAADYSKITHDTPDNQATEHSLHSDLKPGNIFFGKGRARLSDFGLSTLVHKLIKKKNTVIGSPYYLTPERVRAREHDVRSEVFSLAAITYETLTGKRLIKTSRSDAGAAFDIVRQINNLDGLPREERQTITQHFPQLEKVFDKALANQPEDRYQTATEFAQAFTQGLKGQQTNPLAKPD